VKTNFSIREDKFKITLLLILLSGFLVRIHGISFGEPFLYHIDEWKLVNRAGHLLDIKNFYNSIFLQTALYPPFFIYILAFAFGIYGGLGLLFGSFSSLGAISDFYRSDPFVFHLIGRYISAFMGTATIFFTYLIGKEIFNKKIGLLGALFLSFTFVHVRSSHYSTVDIPTTFFIAIAFLFVILIYKTGSLKYYLLTGVFCAIAIATKFTVGFIAITFFVAHFLRSNDENLSFKRSLLDKRLFYGISLLSLTFVILCPFLLVNSGLFLDNTTKIASTVIKGRIGYYWGHGFFSYITGDQWPGFSHFARNSFAGGMGLHMTIFSIAGAFITGLRLSKKNLLFLSFPVIHFIALSLMSYKAMRNMLPIMPFLVLMASAFIYFIIEKIPLLKKRFNQVLIMISIGCVIPMIADSIVIGHGLKLQETRTLAKQWVESNIPAGAKIAVESKPPQLYNTNPEFTIIGPRITKSDSDSPTFHLVDSGWFLFSYAPDEPVDFDPIEEIKKKDVDYVILDNWTMDRFYLPKAVSEYPIKTAQRHRFYDWVRTNCLAIKKFEPIPKRSIGPTIEVYKIKK